MDKMIDSLNQNFEMVITKIEQLCKFLEIKMSQFYPYLVRQQIVRGIMGLFEIIFPIAAAIFIYKNLKKLDDYGEGWEGMWIVAIVFTVFVSIGLVMLFTSGVVDVLRLFNPNYYAVKEIIRMLTGGELGLR